MDPRDKSPTLWEENKRAGRSLGSRILRRLSNFGSGAMSDELPWHVVCCHQKCCVLSLRLAELTVRADDIVEKAMVCVRVFVPECVVCTSEFCQLCQLSYWMHMWQGLCIFSDKLARFIWLSADFPELSHGIAQATLDVL